MINRIFLLIVLLTSLSAAQTERDKWSKSEDPYLISYEVYQNDYSFNTGSLSGNLVQPFILLYRFVISDQDGDNCPFYPSCSHFYVEAVKETNIVTGTLMFGDRFTRDMNFIDRKGRYPFTVNKRFYDPPGLYTPGDIHYPPTVK
jgi:putative component of membrane protein insertase Oxa1/YidC/SpoIIIJ protein YidD